MGMSAARRALRGVVVPGWPAARRARARETERRLDELEQRMGGLSDTLSAAFRYSETPRTGEPRRLHAVQPGEKRRG
jgi:hypothetical protein